MRVRLLLTVAPTTLLISVAVVGAGSPPAGQRAAASAALAGTQASDWAAVSGPPRRELPFDPLTLSSPPDSLEQLGDHRWWAAMAVQVIVGSGLIDLNNAPWMVNVAESLIRRPELNWDIHVDQRRGQRLRVQLKEVHGGPNATIILTW